MLLYPLGFQYTFGYVPLISVALWIDKKQFLFHMGIEIAGPSSTLVHFESIVLLNPYTPDSAKSKLFTKINYKLGKIEKQTPPHYSAAQQLSKKCSHFRVLSLESKVIKLCITKGFTFFLRSTT